MGDFNPFDITSYFGGTKTEKTQPRNLGDEWSSVLDAQIAAQPRQLAAEQEYQPQYTELALRNLMSTFTGTNGQPGAMELFALLDPDNEKLLGTMNETATSELELGATLDPELAHLYQQSVRGGQAARGLGYGPADALQEGRTLTELGQNLRTQRRGFATTTAGLNANRLAQLLQLGGSSQASAGPQLTNPESAYASTLFGQNYGGALNTNLQNSQNATQLWSGLFGIACWSAREVFGAHDSRWKQFRTWMLEHAPAKFRDWYLQHGARWAQRLAANPRHKAIVRRWMERKIQTLTLKTEATWP